MPSRWAVSSVRAASDVNPPTCLILSLSLWPRESARAPCAPACTAGVGAAGGATDGAACVAANGSTGGGGGGWCTAYPGCATYPTWAACPGYIGPHWWASCAARAAWASCATRASRARRAGLSMCSDCMPLAARSAGRAGSISGRPGDGSTALRAPCVGWCSLGSVKCPSNPGGAPFQLCASQPLHSSSRHNDLPRGDRFLGVG